MHTILYLGPTTDLDYERSLLEEWGKRCVQLATCAVLPAHAQLAATGTDSVVPLAAADPLRGVDAVVIENGELDAEDLVTHPDLAVVVLLDDQSATTDVAAATKANVWVTRATCPSSRRPQATPRAATPCRTPWPASWASARADASTSCDARGEKPAETSRHAT